MAFLTYIGNEFWSFAAKNENDLWRHSRLKLGNDKSVPDPLKLLLQILILKNSSRYLGASLWIHWRSITFHHACSMWDLDKGSWSEEY